jgi:hypothetical protein
LIFLGQLNQEEFCLRTDHFLAVDPAIEHLHNQLIVGIFTNVGRDPPEPGVAPFVSANDKPVALPKPLSGDAAEQRLRTEVMQLPARDRRRLKDVPDVSFGMNVGNKIFIIFSRKSQYLRLVLNINWPKTLKCHQMPDRVQVARLVSVNSYYLALY